MILLSHLISEFADALRIGFAPRLLPGHERALTAMQACRTEHSPVLVVRCAACGQVETLPHSCGHRTVRTVSIMKGSSGWNGNVPSCCRWTTSWSPSRCRTNCASWRGSTSA